MLNDTVNGRDVFLAELREMPGRQEIAPNHAARSGPSGSSMDTRRLSLACCVVAGSLAGLTILGWTTGLRILASFGPRYIPMVPSAALLFLLLGAATAALVRAPSHRIGRVMSRGG